MCFSCELPEIGRHIYHHQLPLLLLLLLMMMLPTSACRLLLLLAVIIIAGTASAQIVELLAGSMCFIYSKWAKS